MLFFVIKCAYTPFVSYIFRWAEKLDRLTSTATKDPEGFVGHPVNAFKLMKRLNTEWSELENLVLKDMSDGKTNESSKLRRFCYHL